MDDRDDTKDVKGDIDDTKELADELSNLFFSDCEILGEEALDVKFKPPKQYDDVLVTPLVQVHSISIHNKKPQTICEIYGHIRGVDCSGDPFYLFRRDAANPDIVNMDDGLLSLDDAVIVPFDVTLDFLLIDKARDNLIVSKGKFNLDVSTSKLHTEHNVVVMQGQDKFYARVHYSLLQYGVLATISVLYFSKEDDFDLQIEDATPANDDDDTQSYESLDPQDCNDYDSGNCGNSSVAHVSGSVVARSNDPFPTKADGKDNYSTVLLSMPRDQSVLVNSGGFIELYRSVVAVPVFSRLIVEVNFSYHEDQLLFAKGNVEFKPWDLGRVKKDIGGENGRIRVLVNWGHAYEKIQRSRNLKRSSEGVLSSDRQTNQEEQAKKQKLLLDRQSSAAAALTGHSVPLVPKEVHQRVPISLVEVHSVVVHGKDFMPFQFYGTVSAEDGFASSLFETNETYPLKCPASGTPLSLEAPPRVFSALDEFAVFLDLKDVGGRVVSRGSVSWMNGTLKPWFDKQLCSVVRGDEGFAAVYYTTIYDGVKAVVEVKLFHKYRGARVYGELVASYGTFEYATPYEALFFQSPLFQKGLHDNQDNPPALNSGAALPLLKSHNAVPINSPLIIDADMIVSPAQVTRRTPDTILRNRLVLKADRELCSGRIGGENCYIEVSVNWFPYPL